MSQRIDRPATALHCTAHGITQIIPERYVPHKGVGAVQSVTASCKCHKQKIHTASSS